MVLKDVFKQVFILGFNSSSGQEFELWWETHKDSKEFKNVLREFLAEYGNKNVVAPGSIISVKGDFRIGDG